MGGSSSNQLQSIFSGKNAYWYAASSLSEPIFDGGRIRSNYHLSQAQEAEMLLEFRKTVLNALKAFWGWDYLDEYRNSWIHAFSVL